MNTLTKTGMGRQNSPRESFGDPFQKETIQTINRAIDDALASFEVSRQKCLLAGQMLIEIKPLIPHGQFQSYIERNFPRIAYPTANRWMAAAENIVKFLPPPESMVLDISVLLTSDAAKLSAPDAKYKQMLLDLNGNTTLKDAANGVFNEGDEAHRIKRAVNGKIKGGKGTIDRKDFPTFIGRKLSDLSTHLRGYNAFTAPQLERTELLFKQNLAKFPSPVLELITKICREELKTR